MKNKDLKFSNFKNLPKILLVIFLIVFILQMIALIVLLIAPFVTQAAEAIPALNPSCWQKDACEQAGGYTEFDAACGGKGSNWFRCYPGAKPISLGVKIEGVGEVRDAAEYIALIYKYAVGIGAILAVVMILWGGVVYLTAGGTPERIKSAKDYISNALVGLILLYTSYLLLQTLNPDLVKLKMPRVYMIRPIYAGEMFCRDLVPAAKKELLFVEAAKSPEEAPKSFAEIKGTDYKLKIKQTKCGQVYYEKDRADQTCIGSNCEGWGPTPEKGGKLCDGEVSCVCILSEELKKYLCAAGSVVVDVKYDTKAKSYITRMNLWGYYGSGLAKNLGSFQASFRDETMGKQMFMMTTQIEDFKKKAEEKFNGNSISGLFFCVSIRDWGLDDDYLIGGDGTQPLKWSGGEPIDPDFDCQIGEHSLTAPEFSTEYLLPLEDIEDKNKNGDHFSIEINRNQFPDR